MPTEAPATEALVFDLYGTLFDVQSVFSEVEAAFPGHGAAVTQLWRMKQLEYTWLRTLMHRFVSFETLTADALAYALDAFGLGPAPDGLASAYDRLEPFAETEAALAALAAYKLVVLSNGSSAGLEAVLTRAGLRSRFDAVLSVEACGAYKPDPRAYALIEHKLGLAPERVVFVSSNGFDIAGAKSFGLRVARIDRGSGASADFASPAGIYRAVRGRPERFGYAPDWVVGSLAPLARAI